MNTDNKINKIKKYQNSRKLKIKLVNILNNQKLKYIGNSTVIIIIFF